MYQQRKMSPFLLIYIKANDKYMKNYNKNKESSYFQYCRVNNLCDWAVSQNLPVINFEWIEDSSQFNEDFMKTSRNFTTIYHFYRYALANVHDKTEHFTLIRNLKQSLNHWLVLKKAHWIIIWFKQNA